LIRGHFHGVMQTPLVARGLLTNNCEFCRSPDKMLRIGLLKFRRMKNETQW
jgi:hypothetical protein